MARTEYRGWVAHSVIPIPAQDGRLWAQCITPLGGILPLRALAAPGLRQAFEREAIETIGSSPEAFGAYIKSELLKWGKLVKSSGLKID